MTRLAQKEEQAAKTGGAKGRARDHRDDSRDGRREIKVTVHEHKVTDAIADAIADDPDIYQRAGLIVRVIIPEATSTTTGRSGGPKIEPLQTPTIREAITKNCALVQERETRDAVVTVPVHPPAWAVQAVHARAHWPKMRRLNAVIEYPVLTPAGKILSTEGYDASTQLFLAGIGEVDPVPTRPTTEQIKAAVDLLDDVVRDFPFESDSHRAAFISALLTPLARFAFPGPSPLFLADANQRGSGKTLLMEIISLIITGRPMIVSTFTSDGDELRKRITSHALAGDRLVLLDNLSGFIKSPVLDAMLTSVYWRDRILGSNKTVDLPLNAVWFGTGNNVSLYSDTARRTCLIRLESPEENPEKRTDFKYPDIIKYAFSNRPKLISAALTILAGYCSAGRPDQHLPAWGSFSGWSDLVRGCVVWAGWSDPGETRLTITENDPTTTALGLLMQAWEQADPHHRGLTAGEFIEKIRPPKDNRHQTEAGEISDWVNDARAALDVLLDRLDPRPLGNKLRNYRRKVVDGRYFDRAGEYQNSVRWTVYPAEQFSIGRKDTHQTHETHDASGECGECGESVPGQVKSKNSAEPFSTGGNHTHETHDTHKPGLVESDDIHPAILADLETGCGE